MTARKRVACEWCGEIDLSSAWYYRLHFMGECVGAYGERAPSEEGSFNRELEVSSVEQARQATPSESSGELHEQREEGEEACEGEVGVDSPELPHWAGPTLAAESIEHWDWPTPDEYIQALSEGFYGDEEGDASSVLFGDLLAFQEAVYQSNSIVEYKRGSAAARQNGRELKTTNNERKNSRNMYWRNDD